ncbi:glutamate-rich WD repeat-containing protein 1 [Cimex lectularius]|uniref:Glutamate-rich WD repeat-containing protein 1 n=1 Tax=Cimex lectularius TaxID=79782 RepID=A0A8I6RQW0_CIMLE|nr:glutamate-rich WD repeat-containing protein 1 [Cimex lectularius]
MGESDEMEVDPAEGSSNKVKKNAAKGKKEVVPRPYLPGMPMKKNEELVYDPSAYHMLHEAQTGAPSLSFDIIPDGDGDNRTQFPHSAYLVAGTQADRPNGNNLIVMKVENLVKTHKNEDESSSESEDEDEEGFKLEKNNEPFMRTQLIKHYGCVNRIRTTLIDGKVLAGVWSEMGKVTVVDISPQLQCLVDPTNPLNQRNKKKGVGDPIKPLYVFTGHRGEGYGIDWCPTQQGVLATGDCKGGLHIWTPRGEGWSVNKNSLVGHTDSVEDLQWSPNEPSVISSCSVDKSIRIWDTRDNPNSACKLAVNDAHTSDVNVISWNKKEPLILSGGDDGYIHVWDLRNFKSQSTVASLKHHKDSITTVEWMPLEGSIFASGGEDDQITIWDLAVERDEAVKEEDVKDLPPQLLFIHQGQKEIKELHWHKQIPGMIISTSNTGFNFFKTISV